MKLFTALHPCLVGFFRSGKRAEVNLLSVECRPGLEGRTAGIPADPLGQFASGMVPFPVSTVVPNVLGVGANSEIFQSVIERVSVDVVYDHSLLGPDSLKGKNDTVNHQLVVHARKVGINAHIGRFLGRGLVIFGAGFLSGPPGVRPLPQKIRDEVVSWSVPPVQFPGFGFVSKRLLKKFKGRQLFSRMHNQVFGYVFRRIESLSSLCAALFSTPNYNSTAVSQ
jgi:hypothetical protein